MAEDAAALPDTPADTAPPRSWRSRLARALAKYGFAAVLGLVGAVLLGVAGLDSDIGHRFITDWLRSQQTASGLSVAIGRIDGSIYDRAQLEDVTLRDTRGVFARVPVVAVDWRPLAWLRGWLGVRQSLDIRRVELQRGLLMRAPQLRPGPANAALLPDFDVRIDRLVVSRMTVAAGVAGPLPRRVDLTARADLHRRRALVDLDSRLGGADRLRLLLDADEAADHFTLALDYAAPRGGLLAALTGASATRAAKIAGAGSWSAWRGTLAATQDGAPLAALALANHAGALALTGVVHVAALAPAELRDALGATTAINALGRLSETTLDGRVALSSPRLALAGHGAFDLHAMALHSFALDAAGHDTLVISPVTSLAGASLHAVLDGPLARLGASGRLAAARWTQGGPAHPVMIDAVTATATAAVLQPGGWRAPLAVSAGRIITRSAPVDARLTAITGHITLTQAGTSLMGDDMGLAAPGLAASGVLRGDLAAGGFGITGHAAAKGLALARAGTNGAGPADADASFALGWGRGGIWHLAGNITGRLTHVANPTLATLAGASAAFSGDFATGAGQPLLVNHARLSAENLTLSLSGRRAGDGSVSLAGSGQQARYGAFTVSAVLSGSGPHATLGFADPLPGSGIRALQLAIAPDGPGYGVAAEGQSPLGPFSGSLGLMLPEGSPAVLSLRQFRVSNTDITGAVSISAGGASGRLALAGGGVSGTVDLAPRGSGEMAGQGLSLALSARDAHFGGDYPLNIGRAEIDADGLVRRQHSSITAHILAQGIGKGHLFIGRAAGRLALNDGAGSLTISLAGRRGSRFELQADAAIAPGRVALAANGLFAGQTIAMPARAVFGESLAGGQASWRLAPAEIDFGPGRAIATGQFGGGNSELGLALSDMPLSLGDAVFADLGLGGRATGVISYAARREGAPGGNVRLLVHGLTRAGLVLTSRPIDLALAGELSPAALQLRAVAADHFSDAGRHILGRVQARVDGLPQVGTLIERLRAGRLAGAMRYSGPADAPWRLMAIDAFDMTGPIDIAADISGDIDNPRLTGSLASTNLHLANAITGTDVSGVSVHGGFAGSRLTLGTLAGRTAGGGQLVGSGSIDFTGISDGHGPAIDLALAATRAQLLNRSDMAVVASGPLRIVSDGTTGTIAGRLGIDSARWRLGQAPALADLPNIATRDINRSADIAPASAPRMTWNYLVDAAGPGKIRVTGLGIDSDWGAAIRLRGSFAAPQILGRADLVTGSYEFAGQHFDMTRGHLDFGAASPPDPRLAIAATSSANGLNVTVNVGGTSLHPEISFSSVPPLPEQELLSRLLFGASVNGISAPEALQLGAALAALHGNGEYDPINRLRSLVGLDRLRIVSADPTVPHQTGVAVGKYIGHRAYAEVVSDGRGYSATNLEFRITRWLSLLGSLSTIGRQSVNARVSHDY